VKGRCRKGYRYRYGRHF